MFVFQLNTQKKKKKIYLSCHGPNDLMLGYLDMNDKNTLEIIKKQ